MGPEQAAIYRTPEGTAFVDVLAQKDQTDYQSRNEKDRDILQWEADLRKQLAEKKGVQRKLTKEEQSRVEAQLAKESAIRTELTGVVVHLERGYGLIRSLALGPPTPVGHWMWPALSSIVATVARGSGLLMGHIPFETYIACSEKITARLGTARKFIGSATLRRLPLLQVPREYEQEPLGGKILYLDDCHLLTYRLPDQILRVLYRLKLTAEQRPLDIVSFLYTVPLLFTILRKGGVGKSQDDTDVQVILALEIIALHVQLCMLYLLRYPAMLNYPIRRKRAAST